MEGSVRNHMHSAEDWLPGSVKEMRQRGWDEADVILFTGDAYIDHPSFGAAAIGRIIESEGLRVALVPQPNWRDDLRDFTKLGRPKFFFGVTAGNMDSMVNHYTAARRLRSDDAYTPGGKAGFRPDYPTVVYTGILKRLFPDVPVVIGGIEASMRRLAHYDFWKDRLEPSVLVSSGADLLVYGMGDQPVREIVRLLKKGVPFSSLKTINQTGYKCNANEKVPADRRWNDIMLFSFREALGDKEKYAQNFVRFEKESNKIESARFIEEYENHKVIINPPFQPATVTEADRSFDLPFTYLPHPRYEKKDAIPAYEMIKFSVNMHRGCFGGCSFCAIAAHQGRQVVSRSESSVLKEIEKISGLPGFKGYLSDLGGPSANMYGMKGIDYTLCTRCSRPSCIWPSVCANLNTDHSNLTRLYKKVNGLPGIKKAFISSGVRYDLLFREYNPKAGRPEMEYLEELILNHVPGRFKVAPEHSDPAVLRLMRKTSFDFFRKLWHSFTSLTKRHGLNYELIPYLISSHPGCTDDNMRQLASELKKMNIRPEQVQDFTPTPMTLSTTMYYCGFDPYTGRKVAVTRDIALRKKQKGIMMWHIEKRAGGSRENKMTGSRKHKKW